MMAAPAILIAVVQWFIQTFGQDLLVVGTERLKSRWRKTFADHPFLILGPKGSGKSSLLLFLESDKPFNVVEGERRTPEPTLGVAVVNTKFEANKDTWLKIKHDLPGDEQLREYWHQFLKEVRPHGIVYTLDGRALYDGKPDHTAIQEHVQEIFTDVFDHYPDADKLLKVFYIFVNFSDLWSVGRTSEKELTRALYDEFEMMLRAKRAYNSVNFDVKCIQLSPHREKWGEAREAMNFFGVQIAGQ